MKRLLTFLAMVALMTVALFTGSCERYRSNLCYRDSVQIARVVKACLPAAQRSLYTFDHVDNVLSYKTERRRQAEIDSTFLTLTDKQITDIVSVLKKGKPSFTISDIVQEYQAYRRVYDGLPAVKEYRSMDPPEESNKEPTKVIREDTICVQL